MDDHDRVDEDALWHVRGGQITMDEALLLLLLCSTLPDETSYALLIALVEAGAFVWPDRPLIPAAPPKPPPNPPTASIIARE